MDRNPELKVSSAVLTLRLWRKTLEDRITERRELVAYWRQRVLAARTDAESCEARGYRWQVEADIANIEDTVKHVDMLLSNLEG